MSTSFKGKNSRNHEVLEEAKKIALKLSYVKQKAGHSSIPNCFSSPQHNTVAEKIYRSQYNYAKKCAKDELLPAEVKTSRAYKKRVDERKRAVSKKFG